jgi:CheY-like chemotaxis protein
MPGGNPMNTDEGAGLTLLVIDDEYQNLELIESVLQQPGLDILTTTSPEG